MNEPLRGDKVETSPNRFRADFNCAKCGSLLSVRTWTAVVEGPGMEFGCRHCKQVYLITKEGAAPITKGVSDFDGIDAEGKPYKVPVPTPVEPTIPAKGESNAQANRGNTPDLLRGIRRADYPHG